MNERSIKNFVAGGLLEIFLITFLNYIDLYFEQKGIYMRPS